MTMEDETINNLNEIIKKQQQKIEELYAGAIQLNTDCNNAQIEAKQKIRKLEKIAELALDLHTKDPLNIKNKWGVSGVQAEKLLCKMIEKGILKNGKENSI